VSPQVGTIAALLTPPAPGAIAVIGLAGGEAHSLLGKVLRRASMELPPELHSDRPILCRLVDQGKTLDDAIIVAVGSAPVPRVEISLHGGPRIVQRALMLLERGGAAVVDAHTFVSATAADLPVEQEADRALLGVKSRRLAQWLIKQRAILPQFMERFDSLSEAERKAFHRRTAAAVRLVKGLRIALVGLPNAGKSTLANRLIGHDRILTSPEPGTTRDWVTEIAVIRGWPVTLTDTAGLRQTACPIETEAIRRAAHQAGSADLVLHIVDAAGDEAHHADALAAAVRDVPVGVPRIMVLNKCDLPFDSPSEPDLGRAVRVSALTGAGIDELEQAVERLLSLDLLDEELPTGFLERHLA